MNVRFGLRRSASADLSLGSGIARGADTVTLGGVGPVTAIATSGRRRKAVRVPGDGNSYPLTARMSRGAWRLASRALARPDG